MAEILHVTTVRSLSFNRLGGIGKARRFPSSGIRSNPFPPSRSNDVSSECREDREKEIVANPSLRTFWKSFVFEKIIAKGKYSSFEKLYF